MQKELNKINPKLQAAGLGNAKLRIYQNGEKEEINLTNLKADIISDLYKESKTNTESIAIELNNIKSDIAKNKEYFKDLPNELKTIFPDIDQVVLSETYIQDNETNETKKTFVLNIDENSKISKKELSAIESWLKTRTKQENVKIFLAK